MNPTQNENMQWDNEQINAVVADLARLRLQVDLELVPRYPYLGTKIYPLGRCKEIRDAVFMQLQQQLPQATEPGLLLIRDQLAKGKSLKKIWGALRGVYFQNAMSVGDWYLDVSNDTVNPNKPRIEVLPLASSGFAEVTSFEQFISVARTYWEVEVYRNDICPALAPYMPLLYVSKDGTCWLGEATDNMLAVATTSQFSASERILLTLPAPPKQAVIGWQQVLSQVNHSDFLHQQGDAVEYCQAYRAKHYEQDPSIRDSAVMAYVTLPKSISLA
ncbi:MAG: hypothetical protein KJ556_06570 [Gammaproteobacteria bacterium]|nr:hypothetical protein [Gammaproteobacteria bacterium]MBU2059011.1 hypothetical protein [Gammaproteobacteria bacterium]MBU2174774.1 hypothetical protein [Gammaproteobacteria bacterium]MBU2245779.1 hypothetical protein [Gammaproteobacteria bacterium]MBU2343261.1 hypothetical protein [Gammaproteobacteria bacterium]